MCYNLPVLNAILKNNDARALYLFPTKALSADQVSELYELIEAMDVDVKTFTYDGDTPAVATPDTKNADAPVEGANSFTEAQAKERIADAGYTDVGALKLDDKGVWRGTATKDGQSVSVGLDYQGNVVTN